MNKINPSIVFIDLDGTTYDKHNSFSPDVSDVNKNAIKELNKKIPVIISTGRSPEFVLKLQKELDLKYSIVQNGAYIYNDKGKIVYQDSIDSDIAAEILHFAQDNNAGTKVNNEMKFFGIPKILHKIISKWGFEVTNEDAPISTKKKYTKLIIIGKTRRRTRKLKKHFEYHYPHLHIVSSFKEFSIEITGKNSSKGLANKWVAKKMNLDYKKGLHFGDSMNDSTVVEFMNLVAMKNSSPRLKKIATIVSNHTNKNAGLSKAFEECII